MLVALSYGPGFGAAVLGHCIGNNPDLLSSEMARCSKLFKTGIPIDKSFVWMFAVALIA